MNNTKKLFDLLTKSKNQSKIWRKQQKWYKNGKSNECEIYQRKQLSTILNLDDIPKTKLRLHISTNKKMTIKLDSENNYTIGGEIYNLPQNKNIKIERK